MVAAQRNWCISFETYKEAKRAKDWQDSISGLQRNMWFETELKSAEKQRKTDSMKQDNV